MINNSILFIEGAQGFVNQAIVKNLTLAGFDIVRVSDRLDDIADAHFDADLMLYYAAGNAERVKSVTEYLTWLAKSEHKTLCIVGESESIRTAKTAEDAGCITAVYQRPVNVNKLVEDMREVAASHDEYKRPKSVLVIDDDSDFLKITCRWLLNGNYKANGIRSGEEALIYLQHMRPDLILLDYEMPGMDGYQVMSTLKSNPLTRRIPIIFLTGKNDRDSVMKLVKTRPDGYLLKSMTREELLDTLDRFFAGNMMKSLRLYSK